MHLTKELLMLLACPLLFTPPARAAGDAARGGALVASSEHSTLPNALAA
jgi:hypothetical protein